MVDSLIILYGPDELYKNENERFKSLGIGVLTDTISCTHFHPYQPLLFTGSGQRHYRYENEEIESSYTENPLYQPFFSIYKLSWNYTPSYYSTMNTTM